MNQSHCTDSQVISASSKPGAKTNDVWSASLMAIYTSCGHDYWTQEGDGRLTHGIQSLEEAECIAGQGIRGDRYFHGKKNHKGQVTFMNAKVVDLIRQQFRLPKLPASIFRRNLIVADVDLSQWLGNEFEFQGIRFEGSQECRPCSWMDRVVAQGVQAFMREPFYGGLRARVLTDGTLRVDR